MFRASSGKREFASAELNYAMSPAERSNRRALLIILLLLLLLSTGVLTSVIGRRDAMQSQSVQRVLEEPRGLQVGLRRRAQHRSFSRTWSLRSIVRMYPQDGTGALVGHADKSAPR